MNSLLSAVLPQEGGLEVQVSGKYTLAILLMSLLTLAGVAAGIHSLYLGHEHTFGVSREVPLGNSHRGLCFFSS